MRHRDSAGNWTFQSVPDEVKDTIHRSCFLPGPPGAQTGWAVAGDGSVLKTLNSGSLWTRVAQFAAVLPGKGPYEVLYAVNFLDPVHGWIVGLHGIWWTEDAGLTWNPATLKLADGSIPTTDELEEIELYEMDAVLDPLPPAGFGPGVPIVGLAAAEPGLVFRSANGRDWQVVWDIRDHCTELTQTCEQDICDPSIAAIWEPWDIQISRHPTQKLALMCGGIGFQCGMIWRSTDDGTTWVKEEHECVACSSPPCAQCTLANGYSEGEAYPGDTTLYRLKKMRTTYNLAIFDADNSAVAVGYNGQALWRNPSAGIWEDRSTHSENYLVATNATVFPLTGVSTNGGSGSTGIAIATGWGGYIRRSTDGGQTWVEDYTKGEPYRSQDVHFLTSTTGWMVGQHSRIAKTIDGGLTWNEALPPPGRLKPPLHAITFADIFRGVAVGGNSGGALYPGAPNMLYTLDGGSSPWLDVSSSLVLSPGGFFGSLRDVTFVPGTSTVWAAGDSGFIARSTGNGASWRQMLINGAQITGFEINGLAFKDASSGLFAGRVSDIATIFQVKVGATGALTWTKLTVVPHGTAAPVADLGDVEIFGSNAYAVGETLETLAGGEEIRKGIVLKATFTGSASGGSFGSFTPFSSVDQFPKCQVGANLRGLEHPFGPTIPVLNRIAIATTGELWVGGECGRVWRYASGAWTEYQSQTDSNMIGISFPTAAVGFFLGYRYFETGQALVRYQ